MHPDAQEILDTLEENRDWYQNMIPASPPPESDEQTSNNSRRDSLAAVAEKIKFQITIEEPEDEDEETPFSDDKKELLDSSRTPKSDS